MIRLTNALLKDLKKQKRENSSLLFLDNLKIIKDAITAGHKPIYLISDNENILSSLNPSCPVYLTERSIIEQLSDTKTPQGVLCIAEYLQDTLSVPKNNFLILDNLQDPGNVGTLIRTACAAGFESVFLLDSVKVTSPKLIRASAGTIFDIKLYSMSRQEFIEFSKGLGLVLVKTDMAGENIFNCNFSSPVGVVIGNEGQGVSKELSNICKQSVAIPMKKTESLNASVAGAIVMYQIAKNTF